MQKAEGASGQYRKWLTAVAECAKALGKSRETLTAAKADLKASPMLLSSQNGTGLSVNTSDALSCDWHPE